MNISELSIRRPVLSTVLTIIILLFGFIGYNYLGVREYPSVDNPIISVQCSYTGANADVIENQINLSILQCYHVSFTIRGKSYECYGYSHRLTEKNAEAFAWGIIRSHVKRLNMPLDGYATNVTVRDLNDGWNWDMIPLTSDIENN